MNWLPNDVARCPGSKVDGEWRECCADCLRRTAPVTGEGWHVQMAPPPFIASVGCASRIAS